MSSLPMILSGPIVRDVTHQSVSVWLALRERATVHLDVYGNDGLAINAYGSAVSIRLADSIHICLVSALITPDDPSVKDGTRCLYNIRFITSNGKEQDLFDTDVLSTTANETDRRAMLVYPGNNLPSFRIPPTRLTDWRLAHASCRKPHGAGKDALGILDEELNDDIEKFDVLFLTGDQIYADDVHPILLNGIHHIANQLSDVGDKEFNQLKATYGDETNVGYRNRLLKKHATFSSKASECHLVTFMEFVCMYLLVWSDTLWEEVPDSSDLKDFKGNLPAVRRVLSNTATYMMFDDHEITDDWNRTGAWLQSVTDSDLGPRVLTNGLLAYTFFQHWGNVPERFSVGSTEQKLLELSESWVQTEIDHGVSLVEYLAESLNIELTSIQVVLDWSYRKEYRGFRVVALDTRTQRSYESLVLPAGLMTRDAIDDLLWCDPADKKPLIVVSAAPVLGMKLLEGVQQAAVKMVEKISGADWGNKLDLEAWSHNESIYHYLLNALSKHGRVVVLSGDVHYAFGSALSNKISKSRIVNFVSSSAKNQFFSKTISTLLLAEYLSTEGGATLEGTIEQSIVVEKDEPTTLCENEWVEELIIDEVTNVDVQAESLEEFTEGKRKADVVGSTNVGFVTFDGEKAVQEIAWKLVTHKIRTEHEATFEITNLS